MKVWQDNYCSGTDLSFCDDWNYFEPFKIGEGSIYHFRRFWKASHYITGPTQGKGLEISK